MSSESYSQVRDEDDVLIDTSSTIDDDDVISSTAEGEVTTVVKERRCCRFPPSPYPVYIANVCVLAVMTINKVLVDDLIYNKICYQHFHNVSLCSNSTFSKSHSDLQTDAALWSNFNSLAQMPLLILINLMLSSYCDKVGHKLPLVLPCLGTAMSTVCLAILATPQFIDWSLGYIFFYSVLCTMLGSFPTVIMSSFSYAGLIATKENRSLTMGMCEASILIGMLIGTSLNGPVIDALGLSAMAYINAVIALLPLPIVLIFLTDVTSESSSTHSWKDVIGMDHVLDAFKCVFKKREGNKRLFLNLSFVVYTCIFMASASSSGISFLYLVKDQGFSLTLYSVFSGYSCALKGVACPVTIFLLKKFIKPEQYTVGVVAISCTVLGYAVMPITSIAYSVWIGTTLLGLELLSYAVIRSLQLTFCEKNEFGKMFAYDSIIQTTLGFGGSIALKSLYSATVGYWPGLYLFVCSTLVLTALVAFVCLSFLKRKQDARNPTSDGAML